MAKRISCPKPIADASVNRESAVALGFPLWFRRESG